MPRQKRSSTKKKNISTKLIKHPTPRQGITKYAKSSFKWAESYTSLLMGVVVVIVAVLFVVSLIRATHHVQDTSSTAIGPSPTVTNVTPTPTQQQAHIYIVHSGEDLWHISEKIYGDGYKWVDIAQANNLANPSTIFDGDKLTLPQVTPTQAVMTPSPLKQIITQQEAHRITGNSYAVQSGDDLWDIAVRAYGDGYKWVDIAQANNLADPGLIFSGNVLTIPRD